MRLGIDTSTYFDEIDHGAKYFANGKEVSPLRLLRNNGCDISRIRIWVNPKSEEGKPYLGGDCDLNNFIRLAKLSKELGYSIMLDFHYSDFWCDPSKQMIPKSFSHDNLDQLTEEVYEYTLQVLKTIEENNIDLEFIQIGNEITNGILWPIGKLEEHNDGSRTNYEALIKLLKAGIKGCREIYPKASLILHLEKSYDQIIYNEFFTKMEDANVDYDIIGYSYYPYWHGTFDMFFDNVKYCKKFNKRQMVVELGYAFTIEDYIKHSHGGAQLVVCEENVDSLGFIKEYPFTKDGQKDFTKDFLKRARENNIEACLWWEPLWIPGKTICWASDEGKKYIHNDNPSNRNEWANQCLFDYQGNMNPAFNEFKVI